MVIWVMIAIVIVAAIIIFAVLRNRTVTPTVDLNDPQSQIEKCVKTAVENISSVILRQGGFVDPENYIMFEGAKVAYLLDSGGEGGCANQHPTIVNEINAQISAFTKDETEKCFDNLKIAFEKRGSTVDLGPLTEKVEVIPGRIKVGISKRMTITNDQQSRSFTNFSFSFTSQVYDLANVATEIANAKASGTSYDSFFQSRSNEFTYPEVTSLSGATVGADTNIYTFGPVGSEKKMNIAIRSGNCGGPRSI